MSEENKDHPENEKMEIETKETTQGGVRSFRLIDRTSRREEGREEGIKGK